MINAVFIGNIAIDTNIFYNDSEKIIKKNNGGACFYSSLPASTFYRVGIVSRIGYDFDQLVFDRYNIDLSGLKIFENEKTTQFIQIYKEDNSKNRQVIEEVNENLLVDVSDIPQEYLSSKYIHIATNEPSVQLKLVKYIRSHSNAIISIDTISGYAEDILTKQAFDLVDIAFIDDEFSNLKDCNAKIKIIKCGKRGCKYISDSKNFFVDVEPVPIVDKTGAGDCMNGVFINLLANGHTEEEALAIANKVATISVTDYGIEHVCDKTYNYNLKL